MTALGLLYHSQCPKKAKAVIRPPPGGPALGHILWQPRFFFEIFFRLVFRQFDTYILGQCMQKIRFFDIFGHFGGWCSISRSINQYIVLYTGLADHFLARHNFLREKFWFHVVSGLVGHHTLWWFVSRNRFFHILGYFGARLGITGDSSSISGSSEPAPLKTKTRFFRNRGHCMT